MKKRLIYITSFLLLLIFPITAIGMDISVHKCKHSGNLHFSFYQLDSKYQYDDCCCKSDAAKAVEPKPISCCDSETKETAKPINKVIEKQQESTQVESCCSKEKIPPKSKTTVEIESKSNTYESTSTITENIKCENEISKPVTCCDISKVSFSLSSAPIRILSSEKTIRANVYIPHLTLISILSYQTSDKSKCITIGYPLKEPLNKIISFISHQSNQKDDSDSHS